MTKKIQEIVDKISAERGSLLDSVAGLSESQLDYKPAEDQWSIADILHHLALADEANVKLAGLFLRQSREQGFASDASPDASVLDCMDKHKDALTSTRAKAPDRVTPLSHLPAAESMARLRASREKLLESMRQLAAFDLNYASFPHPLLGPMNAYQWFVLAGFHETRHTAQIERIKSGEGFPAT
jgi:hypothetical protein